MFTYQHNGFEADASGLAINCNTNTSIGFTALTAISTPVAVWYERNYNIGWLIQQIIEAHEQKNIKQMCRYKQLDLRINREVRLSAIVFK